jgi:hypothetical protein
VALAAWPTQYRKNSRAGFIVAGGLTKMRVVAPATEMLPAEMENSRIRAVSYNEALPKGRVKGRAPVGKRGTISFSTENHGLNRSTCPNCPVTSRCRPLRTGCAVPNAASGRMRRGRTGLSTGQKGGICPKGVSDARRTAGTANKQAVAVRIGQGSADSDPRRCPQTGKTICTPKTWHPEPNAALSGMSGLPR